MTRRQWITALLLLAIAAAVVGGVQTAAAQPEPDGSPHRLFMPQVAGSSAGSGGQQPVAAAPVMAQAITTIPDNFFTVIDSGGANDVNSEQNDLTQMGRDDTNPNYYDLFWSWDTTNFTAQKGNACALFDSNNNSNIDYAVCAEIENVPSGNTSVVMQTSVSPQAVTCDDGKDDRCTQPSNKLVQPSQVQAGDLVNLAASPPANLVTDTDPFANLNPDQTWPKDSTIRLRILKSFLPANAVLANVCVYPSLGNTGNNNPFDCVVTPGGGFLKIVKVAPTGTTQVFNFTVNPGSLAKSITGSGNTGGFPMPVGTGYSVVETIPTGWKLDTAACALEDGTGTGTKSGSSVTGITVQSGKITTCTFTDSLLENPPSIDVTKTADPTSLGEPGGTVFFQVDIKNTSDATDPVTITSLSDDVHGSLDGQGTCDVPQTIQPGATYSCSFSASVTGVPGYSEKDIVTAAGADNEGTPVSDSDDATVTITDVPSSITVVKTASPTTVAEPGGNVTFSFVVNNTSLVDAVTISSLGDSIYGDLDDQGTCTVPQTIAAGSSYSCSFTAFVGGKPGDTITNIVTASGTDDDGQPVSDTDDATVTINDVPSSIEVVKTAAPSTVDEPGGDVVFTFEVKNTSAVDALTVNGLVDDTYGNLNGQGNCVLPQTIPALDSYSCSITKAVIGNAGDIHTNTVTVAATDDDGNRLGDTDDATVTVNDIPSAIELLKTADPETVDEPGGDVTFSFVVKNLSTVDTVTINSLSDTVYGDLNGQGDCTVPQTIAAGDSYACSLTAFVGGNAGDIHTNVATASGKDDDGQDVSDDDSATVTLNNVQGAIEVVKTASPTSVSEPGGNVEFTIIVNNLSTIDVVTLDTLSDDVYGNLNAQGDCSVPQTIAASGSYTCKFTGAVSGKPGDIHTNTVTAAGVDDDGDPVSDTDDAAVTVEDVPSSIELVKTASAGSVDEPGANVTFSFEVKNTSAVDAVNITSLTDTVYNDLNGQGDCAVPQVIPAGESYTCSITVFVGGNAFDSHTNVATASGVDDDGSPVTGSDDETVDITDVPSSIKVTKSANPSSVPETGGDVLFTVVVENTSAVDNVTISSIVDDVFGDVSGSCTPALPANLAPGESVTCAFIKFISGEAGKSHVDVATGSGVDDDGTPVKDDDDVEVPFEDVLPDISVTKTADPTSVPETGGNVAFTFVVTNNSAEAATITGLADDKFGLLAGDGDCKVGTLLAAGASCEFSATFPIPAGDYPGSHTNTFTAVAADNDGNSADASDDATVAYTDVLPDISVTKTANPTAVPETGGDVAFTFVVKNNGAEAAAITSLADSKFGTLVGDADCKVGTVLAAGASCDFSITRTLAGDASGGGHTNIFTAVADDDDGNSDSASDNATVDFTNVPPDISVSKTANPTFVPETGGNVAFVFAVTNNSAEAVTMTSLADDKFGTLAGDADCQVGAVLAAGASCDFSATFAIPAGDYPGSHTNIFTAVATDNDNTTDTATDDATVAYTDVLPDISVTKTANPTSVPQIGGSVTFKFVVKNNSAEAATITSLTDDRFGTLAGDADCKVGTVLAAGASCDFSATFAIPAGPYPGSHVNTFTAVASDDDGNSDSASASATVTYTFIDYGQIAPTGTTCQQYVNGTAQDFSIYYAGQGGVVQYGVKSNKINQTNPGVFFYYTGLSKTLAGSGARTVFIDQSDNSAVVGPFKTTKNDVKLWLVSGTNCAQVQLQSSQITLGSGANTGDVQVSFTAAAPAGSYYVLSVKYDTAAVVGTNLGAARPTVKYTFTTDVGKNGSIEETDIKGITLAPK